MSVLEQWKWRENETHAENHEEKGSKSFLDYFHFF